MTSDNAPPFKPDASPTEMFWDAVLSTPDGITSERFMLAVASVWIQPGDLILELGANHGQHSRIFGEQCGEDGQLVLVEADPALAANLGAGAARSGVPMVVVNAAASDRTGDEGIVFYRHTERDQEGSIYQREVGDMYEPVVVKALAVDDIVDAHRMPSFVKIDVEGAEFNVIKGSSTLLEAGTALVACELHRLLPSEDRERYAYVNYDAASFLDTLSERNWALYTLDGRRVSARDWEDAAFHMNYQNWMARIDSPAERFIREVVPVLAGVFAWGATPSPPYPFHLLDFPIAGGHARSRGSWFEQLTRLNPRVEGTRRGMTERIRGRRRKAVGGN